jgi:hypothetical protein
MKKGRNVSKREHLLRLCVYMDELEKSAKQDALLFDVQTIYKCVSVFPPSHCNCRSRVHVVDQK